MLIPHSRLFVSTATLLLLFAALPVFGQQDEMCPDYREFNPARPDSFQYMAPPGCECAEGMEDLNCGYCTSDEACRAHDDSHYCRRDFVWGPDDTYKNFKCDLSGSLANLFTGGKASFYVNLTEGIATLSVYNTENINQAHAVDCTMSGCVFPLRGTGGFCEVSNCSCTDVCSSITKQLVESSMRGNPVGVIVEEEDGEATLTVDMEGAPFPIEAVCTAAACTLDTIPTFEETVVNVNEPTVPGWDDRATFSLIVLAVLGLIFFLLSLSLLISHLATQKNRVGYDQQPIQQEESARTGIRQVLEFRHITSTLLLTPDAAKAYGHKEKKILDDISGKVESGLTAIMGPTGSGKSSLLNVLAAVGHSQARISGQILLNGKQPGSGYRRQVAYVQQDDSLYSTLTVQECVEYSALLRLPKDMKVETKQAYVSRTLQELRLTEIAQNRIGSGGSNAGVSGGERKRVSIGMELVAQPSVLVLDEPTSGLDSFAADKIVNVLSELASRNRIVMVSIHQPSMKCFMRFDQLLVLGGGQVMYQGKPTDVDDHFKALGFACPPMETVADHMLHVVSDETNRALLKKETGALGEPEEPLGNEDQVHKSADESKPLLNELMILFGRTAKDIFRNKQLFFVQLSISVVLAICTGVIFRDVSDNLSGFQNRMGAFYFSLSFFAFSSFSSMDIFVRERHIFVREVGSKYFRAFSYFLAKAVLDMFVLRIVPVTIFSFIFYWMMGLRDSPDAFITFWATFALFNICAGIMSICIGIATPTVGQANLIAAVWFLIMLLFGGFLVNVYTMEGWYAWLKYLSIFYYAFEILLTNELSGLLLSFDAPGYPVLPVYGEVFLQTIGMDSNNQLRDLVCLCCLALGFTVAAYLLLLIRVPRSAELQIKNMERENKRVK